MLSNILIRQYKSCDSSSVRDLFRDGWESYRDPPHLYEDVMNFSQSTLERDMANIEKHYLEVEGGNFWVAEEAVDGKHNRIVGCVGVTPLKPEDTTDASLKSYELVRMSIHVDFRCKGLGRKLVEHLQDFVKDNCGDEVVLFTCNEMTAACKFYEAIGFARVGGLELFTVKEAWPKAVVDGTLHIQRFEKSLHVKHTGKSQA